MIRRIALAAVVLASAFAARGITFSNDPTTHFPRSTPAVAAWLELSLRFDAFNTLIVGLEEPAAPLASLEQVKRITDRLTTLKASGVLAVASVTNVESLHEGADGSLETELLIPAIPTDTAALAKKITANSQVNGALISRDHLGYVIILRADPRRDAAELASAIRAVVEEERGPLIATLFGAPFFQAAIARGVPPWLAPAVLVLLLGVLAVTVRSPRAIASALLAAILSLIVWLGLVRIAGIAMSPSSLTAALLLFVLATLAAAQTRRLPGLAAMGLGGLSLMLISQLAIFGSAMALGALVIAAVIALLQPATTAIAEQARAPIPGIAAATIALIVCSLVARALPFHATPQTIFSEHDEVGRSLAFFDRRFGGPDFIQVDFHGDLRDPEIAARLLRLTDLLEGPFRDVRAVAPILGFLNHGFGGVHRIPTSRESLNNLWFFLEGRPDVRNLVSEKRDEAMIVLRVPSKLPRPAAEIAALVDAAIAASLEEGRASTKARLRALALDPMHVDAVLDGPAPDTKAEVNVALHKWLTSGDSPYHPTEAQWTRIESALASGERELTAVVATFPELGDHAAQLVDSVLAREKDLKLSLDAMALVNQLWPDAPPELRIRAQGVFADQLEPHAGPGKAALITVTGLPIIAPQVERDSLSNLWRALALFLAVGFLTRLAVTRQPADALRTLIEAAAAAAITFAAGALWLGADPGSASLFLLPVLAACVRAPRGFLLALAACGLPLLFTGLLPLARIGWALMIGLSAVALVSFASTRISSSRPGSSTGAW